MCGIRCAAGADVRSSLGKLSGHSNTATLLLQVFVWIGKDANEVERTESVRSGELLDFKKIIPSLQAGTLQLVTTNRTVYTNTFISIDLLDLSFSTLQNMTVEQMGDAGR